MWRKLTGRLHEAIEVVATLADGFFLVCLLCSFIYVAASILAWAVNTFW